MSEQGIAVRQCQDWSSFWIMNEAEGSPTGQLVDNSSPTNCKRMYCTIYHMCAEIYNFP